MHNTKENISTITSTNQDVSEQARKIQRGESGTLNPTGKGGFGDNPQNRSNGSWKKTDTARYKLEKMMELTKTEIDSLISDDQRPLFEQKLAESIANAKWSVIKDMIEQVYGKSNDSNIQPNNESNPPIIRGFVLPMAPEDFLDDDGRQKVQRW